jgi:hypothetical protein
MHANGVFSNSKNILRFMLIASRRVANLSGP